MNAIRARLCLRGPDQQAGSVLVLVTVAMLALLAMAGLALDTGHGVLNKARLQNVVDAAALAAAKVLDQTGDETQATAAATTIFGNNADTAGNAELNAAYDGGAITVTVQFSNTLNPFQPGTAPANYVRVVATGFELTDGLAAVVGFANKELAASAVAGPSPTINTACNVAPMMVCGDPDAGAPYWGYQPDVLDVLKTASGGNFEVGPGNFQLVRMGGQGGSVIRENMAGGYAECIEAQDSIETEPGNTVGPVVQGLNTRFGVYSGPVSASEYPPDVVVGQPSPPLTYDDETDTIMQGGSPVTTAGEINWSHSTYVSYIAAENYDYPPPPVGYGAFLRREMAIPIGDCSTTTNGQGTVPLLGFGCYYLLQQVVQQGQEAQVYGQFLSECQAGGVPGPDPGSGPGPYIIQLYEDRGSEDS